VVVKAAQLRSEVERALASGGRLAVLARSGAPLVSNQLVWRQLGKRPAEYGRALYTALRELDRAGAARILVEEVPDDETWAAIADRLRRAATQAPDGAVTDAT
jgi:L-threonylcarbamoyladenylate synthase